MQDIISSEGPQYNSAYTKRCSKCQLYLPFDDFSLDRGSKDGLFAWCKKCKSKQAKENLTTEKIRSLNMRRLHGISLKEYDRMLADQGGVCHICKQPETARSRTGEIKPLAVDHDHGTGENRMLLCQACNLILGVVESNLGRLDVFIEYLEEMKNREPDTKTIQMRLID